jgi:hypothetical protein
MLRRLWAAERLAQVSRPAYQTGVTMSGGYAQIIDNLVGCSKEEFVSFPSQKLERKLKCFN